MPGGDDPDIFAYAVTALLDNARDQPSLHKADNAVLFWVITPLVFDVGEREQLTQQSHVNLAPPQDFLAFGFIPAYTHSRWPTP